MINNDTKPPKNNYTEKNGEELGYLKSPWGRAAKCVFFRTWPLLHRMRLVCMCAICSDTAHRTRQQDELE